MQGVKCAHEPCTCTVDVGEQYCSHVCKEDATHADVAAANGGRCRCPHPECEAR